MRCTHCGTGNAVDALSCIACGESLPHACARCGQANPGAARFCMACGEPLAKSGVLSTASLRSDGELKQITVLFADVVGSTTLVEALSPEEADRRLAPVVAAMRDAVHRLEGSVVKVQGDGIMALFGAPRPQEDHALRACSAALAMQAAAKALPGNPLPIRVGIHTGEVLARTITTEISRGFDATGIAVHIASRLEHLAPPGGVVLSRATLRAARQFISVENLGAQEVRGLSVPLDIYRLTGLRRGPATLRFADEAERSALMGRESELVTFADALARAMQGNTGGILGVEAEAGVGKSRLCFEFSRICRSNGIRVLEGRVLAHGRTMPFEPIVDIVKAFFDVAPDDPPSEARERITGRLARIEPALSAGLPLLLDFLGLADPAVPPVALDPTAHREGLRRLLQRLVRSAGRDQAAVILLEDLHQIDFGSDSLIEALAEAIPGTRILLLANFRPGYTARWMRSPIYAHHALAPLARPSADDLATSLLGPDSSLAPLLPLIADRTRGNPFFIEEVIRQLAETGHLDGNPGAYRLSTMPESDLVPDNVQAIIAARVDRRPELERALLQMAAVSGRAFSAPVLARLSSMPAAGVVEALRQLRDAGLIHETGDEPPARGERSVFTFRHPMTQEVVYRSLRTERRRGLHGAVAVDLIANQPDIGGAQAGLVAFHFEEAGRAGEAAGFHMKSAGWHGSRDPGLAIVAWKKARQLLAGLAPTPENRFALLMANGQVVNLAWREGLTAVEVEPFYLEALGIARSLGDPRAATLLTAAYGRSIAGSGSAADYLLHIDRAISELNASTPPGLGVLLRAIRAHASKLAGNLGAALADNEYATAHAALLQEDDERVLGFHIPTWLSGMRGQILALMGRYDEAMSIGQSLIRPDAPEVDLLHRILGHCLVVDVAWARADAALAIAHAEAAHALGERSGIPYLMVYGRAYRGLGQLIAGQLPAAATSLESALHLARERHAALEIEARLMADLACVRLRAGDPDRATATAQAALAVARSRGARVWQAYALWVLEGAGNPEVLAQIEATGAALLRDLAHPASRDAGQS